MQREGVDDPMEVEAGAASPTWLERLRRMPTLANGACECGKCYKVKENPLFRIASENVNAMYASVAVASSPLLPPPRPSRPILKFYDSLNRLLGL